MGFTMKIKIEIVGDGREVLEKEIDWRIPLKWLNPFKFIHPVQPKPESAEEEGSGNERPEGWVHPPFP
jgi:hypothetical protein